ncbi:hypothetical protein MTP99_005728 [Tenebrio molitor]|nr:hypothetical protein MTP99_005728 [Tenebrio molitor]
MIGPRGASEMTESTPICRCRVLYLGSSVPQQTKDGLQGIQEPLQELYPDQGATGARGIDSWLSVWSNGILLENVDENHKKITRFFPIESLHYCAAVRCLLPPSSSEPTFLGLTLPFPPTETFTFSELPVLPAKLDYVDTRSLKSPTQHHRHLFIHPNKPQRTSPPSAK